MTLNGLKYCKVGRFKLAAYAKPILKRFFSLTAKENGHNPNENERWNRLINAEAERNHGYSYYKSFFPTSEIAIIAPILQKLKKLNHPLHRTAMEIFFEEGTSPPLDIVVFWFSKAVGHNIDNPSNLEINLQILSKQRVLAESIDLIKKSILLHNSIAMPQNTSADVLLGNKVALLAGDSLLQVSLANIAALRNSYLVELVSSAVCDLIESEFIGLRDKKDNPLPQPIQNYRNKTASSATETKYNAEAEWTHRYILSGASLLAKSCQGTLLLAGHSVSLQEKGNLFGKHFLLSFQAKLDYEAFTSKATPFSLVSAPVLFHLQHDPSAYILIEKGRDDVMNVDYERLREVIQQGPGLHLTQKLQKKHSQAALDILHLLIPSSARSDLANMLL